MKYTVKTIKVIDVKPLNGSIVVDSWRSDMTAIKTENGYLIDHLHNLQNWISNIGKTIEITEATLRGTHRNDTHWGHIGRLSWR